MTTVQPPTDPITLNGLLPPMDAAEYWYHHFLSEQVLVSASQARLQVISRTTTLLRAVLDAYLALQQFLNFGNVIPEEDREARRETLEENLKLAVRSALNP